MLLVALYGWGLLVLILLKKDGQFVLLAPIVGLCTCLTLGAIANMVEMVGGWFYLFILSVGLSSAMCRAWNVLRTPSRLATICEKRVLRTLFFYAAGIPFFLIGLLPVVFNGADDSNGYLLPVAKLMQTGHIGFDPFNARMVVGGANSLAFFQAMSATVLDLQYINVIDRFVGYLLLASSFIFLQRSFAINSLYLFPFIFILFSIEAQLLIVNITPVYTILAILLSLVIILFRLQGMADWGLSIVIGLMAGSLMSLKNTLVVSTLCVLTGCALVTVYLCRDRRFVITRNSFVALAISGVICFLWFWDHLSTPIVLVQKMGFADVIRYLWSYAMKNHYLMGAMFLNGILMIFSALQKKDRPQSVTLLVVSLASVAVTALITQGVSILRYCYPIVLVTSVYYIACCWNET
jgi:hypothetical protein